MVGKPEEVRMINSVIYNEEYGTFQYMTDSGLVVQAAELPSELVELAVISRAVKLKSYPEYTSENALIKYLKKRYKDKSYFYFPLENKGFGVYFAPFAAVKKYFAMGNVITVVPYEFLVVQFIHKKAGLKGPSLFLEFQAEFIKITAIVEGMEFNPVSYTTREHLKQSLSDLRSELRKKEIEVKNILSNEQDVRIKEIFELIPYLYSLKDFVTFHAAFNKNIPHFQNVEALFAHKEKKEIAFARKAFLFSLLLLVTVVSVTLYTGYFLCSKATVSAIRYERMSERIDLLVNNKDGDLIANNILRLPDLYIKLTRFLNLFPKGTVLENLSVEKQGDIYIVSGKGYIHGTVKNFTEIYNILYLALETYGYKVFYGFNGQGKPYFLLKGRLKNERR